MIEELVKWFLKDPVTNLLAIFGGSGLIAAVYKWFSVWNGRRKIQVRILRENYDPKTNPNSEVLLQFEVTNLGEKPTALEPVVSVASLTPKGKGITIALNVQEPDRHLPPHTPRLFTAKAIVDAVYVFCWYKRYRFGISRGTDGIVRHRNAKREEIGFWRYWIEHFLFRYFNVVVKSA